MSNILTLSLRLAVKNPRAIPALIGLGWAFRAQDWYRRAPFMPLPPRDYIRWRNETAYGDASATPPLEEFESFVLWAARMRSLMR